MPIIYKNESGSFTFSLGSLIAVIVLILCVVFWAIEKPLDAHMVLLMIGLLALARLT